MPYLHNSSISISNGSLSLSVKKIRTQVETGTTDGSRCSAPNDSSCRPSKAMKPTLKSGRVEAPREGLREQSDWKRSGT